MHKSEQNYYEKYFMCYVHGRTPHDGCELKYQRRFARAIALIFFLVGLCCCPAFADTQSAIKTSVALYQQGHVLDSIKTLNEAYKAAKSAQERWLVTDTEMDICIHAYEYACMATNAQPFINAGKEINSPRITTPKFIYMAALDRYFAGDIQWIDKNFGPDFATKVADPITDPVTATRLFILNARVWQHVGNFQAAEDDIHRAFSSLLRISNNTAGFALASLLVDLIDVQAENHDVAAAVRWEATVDPVIRGTLPINSFDYAYFLVVLSDLYSYAVPDQAANVNILTEAISRVSKLQISPTLKESLLSTLSIQKAAYLALQGNTLGARAEMTVDPIHARRESVINGGKFSSYAELLYATAEIFFDDLDNQVPDSRWKPLFEKLPDWPVATDLKSTIKVYQTVSLALLDAKSNPQGARKQITDAARDQIAKFDRDITSGRGFPLSSLLDRIVLGLGIAVTAKNPSHDDKDLMTRSMELLNRNSRYALSDSLALVAAQPDDDKRRIAHSLLRVTDQRDAWEVDKLKQLVARVKNHTAFNPKVWTAQITAANYGHDIQRLRGSLVPPVSAIPSLTELQAALTQTEAFVGYAVGAGAATRICVRANHVWTSPLIIKGPQFTRDTKVLRAALTAGYAPSDQLDEQYPVDTAIRIYQDLFGGLSDCLAGVRHLIFFPTADATAIPIGALLREKPPSVGSGYDLSKAHWLVMDFAISYVSSVRDFIAARKLSRRVPGELQFLGVGDPQLRQRVAEGRISGQEVAHRNAPINAVALADLRELPETRIELRKIAALFGHDAKILVGADATEESFRTLPLEHYQILHFATHGLIRGDISGLNEAALVLTPGDLNDPVNDGLLNTTEIANLTLRARLVVLSACNTANFDPLAFGTQVQGLATAFAVAGVPTTIASLWPVESGTSQRIMVQFYHHLLEPQSPSVATALQLSIIDAIKSAPSRAFYHPRFWAPFIVMGDGGARLTRAVAQFKVQSAVTLRHDGGEIISAAAVGDHFITSEIGPSYDGRHSSIIAMHRADGKTLWSIEDRKLAAGRIIHVGAINYTGSFVWEGKSVPVLRAISDSGKELWTIRLKTQFASASIAALAGDKMGAYALLAPLAGSDKGYEFDLIKVTPDGTQRAQISLSANNLKLADFPTYAAGVLNNKLFIAVNIPNHLSFEHETRNDFGMIAGCNTGEAAHLFRIDVKTLGVEAQANLLNTDIAGLIPDGNDLLYAGSEHTDCSFGSETAVFGRMNTDLSAHDMWKDSSPFFGDLTSIERHGAGYVAVGQVSEPLSVQEPEADATGHIPLKTELFTKHPDYQRASSYEALFLEFDKNGSVQRSEFFGDGLPVFPVGMFKLGSEYVAYGSNGYNPWLGYYR